MRPLRLEVEGFTSFRVRQEIDFRELALFVITGPTGSGKTSILDAVALALYGEVPRAGKHDIKQLISLGAAQAKVRLDFRAGGAEYRVARRIPIQGQGVQEATLERIEGETTVPEVERSGVTAVNARIVEILGLDYKSFKTAVLLPQEEFDSFLKGKVEERRNILIRLLDLDPFLRAGKLARERERELETAVKTSLGLISQEYADATSEALDEIRTRSADAAAAAKQVEEAWGEARVQLAEGERLGLRRREILGVADKLETQAEEVEAIAAALAERSGRDKETRAALRAADRVRSEVRKEHDRARAAWRETEAETGGERELARLRAAADTLRKAEQEIERRNAELKRNAAALEGARSRLDQSRAGRAAADEAEAEATRVLDSAVERRRSAEEALTEATRATELAAERRAKAKELTGLREQVETAESTRRAAGRERDRREREMRAAETEHRAVGLRAGLGPGDECPVCGAPVTELPAADPEIESDLAAHRSRYQEVREAAFAADERLFAVQARLEGAEEAASTLEERSSALDKTQPPEKAKAALSLAAAAERDARQRLEAAGRRGKTVREELTKAKVALARLETNREAAEKALDQARKQEESTYEQLSEGLGEPLPEPVEQEIETRRRRLGEATASRDAAEVARDDAETSHGEAEKARRAVAKDLAVLERQRAEQRARLAAHGDQLGGLGVELPSGARGPADLEAPSGSETVEAEMAALTTHAAALRGAARAQAARLKVDVESLDASIQGYASGVGIDVDALGAADAVLALEAATRNTRRAADEHSTDLERLEERLKRKADMEVEIEEKRALSLRYRKVGMELKKDRFIGFLLDESIEELAHRASHELRKISAGQYSLTSSENNFEVVDHANADEHRSVVTLSGGETFLASLALALGLAGGIPDIAGHSAGARLDAMFIDEGFGTLDPESLDQAVEALERLRDGRRMVGIITHVPTLADRIPDGLTVTRTSGHTAVVPR